MRWCPVQRNPLLVQPFLALEYEMEGKTGTHWIWKWGSHFFFHPYAELLHRVPLCQGSQLWRNWGAWSVFPYWDECVWVEGKSLADGSVELSSSSLPVGQEDRDGSLSAGHWLDPSPQLPRSTHTGNWSWQEVGMHPSLAPSPSPPFPSSFFLLSFCIFFSFSHLPIAAATESYLHDTIVCDCRMFT